MPARPLRPWSRKGRGWYVTLEGRQHQLAGPKEQVTKQEVWDRFHKLLANPPQQALAEQQVNEDSIAGLFDLFLDFCQKNRSVDTYEWHRFRLERFANAYPTLTIQELKPYHLQRYLDGLVNLNQPDKPPTKTTKRNAAQAVKRAVAWAFEMGIIDTDPIANFKKPGAGRREQTISDEEFAELLSVITDEGFRDLLVTTYETGCRPQESLRVTAQEIDIRNARWVFKVVDSKGEAKSRVVYQSDASLAICMRLAKQNPTGPLFRNAKGRAWDKSAVSSAFGRVQQRLGKLRAAALGIDVTQADINLSAKELVAYRRAKGLDASIDDKRLLSAAKQRCRRKLWASLGPPKCCLYVLRHTWATRMLVDKQLDSITIATLMGHSDPSMLAKVYAHLARPAYLSGELRRATG